VPFFDWLIVRMASTDSPAEGLSSYAVEMAEVTRHPDPVTVTPSLHPTPPGDPTPKAQNLGPKKTIERRTSTRNPIKR